MPGLVLTDQGKSFDWRARQAKKAGTIAAEALDEVLGKLGALLG